MAVLPSSCIPGLTKTERYYQLFQALGGESDCFFGLTLIEQLRLILDLIGSEECIFTEWDFYASWLESLDPGACTGLTLEYLQKAVYTLLYEQAGSPEDLPSPECFLGLPDEDRDTALIEIIIQSQSELMFDLTKLTLSGPGNTNIDAPSSLLRTVLVDFEPGVFTASLSLQTTNAKNGQLICVRPKWDSSEFSTLQIFNNSTGGTELEDFTADSSSVGELKYVFDDEVGEWIEGGANLIATGVNPLGDLAASLLAYWRFSSGAFLTDSSGNAHTLTNTNAVTNPAGKLGEGAGFVAASSQRLSIATSLVTGLTTFSILLQVKSIGASMALVGHSAVFAGTTTGNASYFVVVTDTGTYAVTGAVIPNDGAWHSVCYRFTGSAVQVSVDAGVFASAVASGTVAAGAFFRLGNGGDGSQYATCTLDEVAVVDISATDAQYAAYDNGGAGAVIPV